MKRTKRHCLANSPLLLTDYGSKGKESLEKQTTLKTDPWSKKQTTPNPEKEMKVMTDNIRILIFLGSTCFLLAGVWLLALVSTVVPDGFGYSCAQFISWMTIGGIALAGMCIAVDGKVDL